MNRKAVEEFAGASVGFLRRVPFVFPMRGLAFPARSEGEMSCRMKLQQWAYRKSVSLGDRRGGRPARLRRHRRDVFAAGVSAGRWREDTGWSVTGVSTAMTIGFLAMAVASMVWGALSDRFGPRPVVLAGSVVLAAAWRWPAGRRSLIEFQLAVRAGGRRRDGGDLRADDGLRDRLVRDAAQPRGVAGLGRHGHGADDHVAARGLAGLAPTTGARRC